MGARPGDVVFTTSCPGHSGAGLLALEHPEAQAGLPAGLVAEACEAHRRPCPHVAAGLALTALDTRLALLDDSDGLARSAQLLAEAAEAGVVLETAGLALAPATRAIAAALGRDPLALALHGGEDYGLVGACAAAAWPHVAETLAAAGHPGVRVGRVEASCRGAWVEAAGGLTPLTGAAGHAHFGR
jgi:thiamine-monophosphate kinase